MKKLVSILMLLVMLISSLAVFAEDTPILISAPIVAFKDVTADDWAYEEIISIAELGFAACDENGNFNASNHLSVADLLALPEWTKPRVNSAIEKIYGENPSPQTLVTRAEFVSAIVGAINAQSEYNGSSFSDVTDDLWYAKDAECAKTIGITKGYEDGTFRGNSAVTKREACVMIFRAKAFLNVLLEN